MTTDPLEQLVDTATVAEMASISPTRVRQLAAAGILPRAGRGKFVVGEVVRALIIYELAKGANMVHSVFGVRV